MQPPKIIGIFNRLSICFDFLIGLDICEYDAEIGNYFVKLGTRSLSIRQFMSP
jgi:hypothetical protein